MEMSYGDYLLIGPYRLVCHEHHEDSTPDYDTDFAVLDVFRGGKIHPARPGETHLLRRHRSRATSTIVALHPTAEADSTPYSRATIR